MSWADDQESYELEHIYAERDAQRASEQAAEAAFKAGYTLGVEDSTNSSVDADARWQVYRTERPE